VVIKENTIQFLLIKKLIVILGFTIVNFKFMYQRLKNWMESEGLKSSSLADTIGVNRATISHILSGRNKPSIDFLEKLLSAYPNINANWLISGIGYMHSDIKKNEVVSTKKIGKVVVFYDDNSFEQLNS
jgi:transcriptional regulator with XRE-family HTH domain